MGPFGRSQGDQERLDMVFSHCTTILILYKIITKHKLPKQTNKPQNKISQQRKGIKNKVQLLIFFKALFLIMGSR